jgi:hypothetical protein
MKKTRADILLLRRRIVGVSACVGLFLPDALTLLGLAHFDSERMGEAGGPSDQDLFSRVILVVYWMFPGCAAGYLIALFWPTPAGETASTDRLFPVSFGISGLGILTARTIIWSKEPYSMLPFGASFAWEYGLACFLISLWFVFRATPVSAGQV